MKPSFAIVVLAALLSLLSGCKTNDTAQQTTPSNSPEAKESAQSTISSNSPSPEAKQSAQQPTPSNSPEAKQSNGVTKVSVIEKEMEIKLSPTTVPAGDVEFVTKNDGKIPHEMVVIKTDLPLDKLPLKDGRLDEDKAGKKIGEIESDELKSGTTKSLRTKLTPGKYLIQCNVPGHFKAGMKAQLTVQ